MFPLPTDDPHVDVHQWIGRGLFFDGEGNAYYTINVSAGGRSILGSRVPVDVDPDKPHIRDEKLFNRSEVFLHWPFVGCMNERANKVAFVAERIPRRQYCRTFAPNQVNVTVPRAYELIEHRHHIANFATKPDCVVSAICYPVYPDGFSEAVDWLRDGWLSVAINRRIILVPTDRECSKLLVYSGTFHVGHIIHRQFTPTTDENHSMKLLKAFKGEVFL